jgi:polysaccharide export outer membrane protein
VSLRERLTKPIHQVQPVSAEVLQPQSVLYWTASPGAGSDSKGYHGRSTVNSDGDIHLGPYGDVHVAGLTQEQAKLAITRQVSRYTQDPKVSVSLHPTTTEEMTVAGSAGTNPVVRTGHAGGGGQIVVDSAPQIETRLVPAPAPGPGLNSRIDTNVIIDPPGSPELPFPRNVNTTPVAGCIGNGGNGGHGANELSMTPLPVYEIGVTDILLIEYKPVGKPEGDQPISGQHLVHPDGTVHLGTWGQVRVVGLTLEAARQAVFEQIQRRDATAELKRLNVDMLAYNSKKYYVITDGAGAGEQVYTFPVTGNETVLDAIGHIGGLPPVASKRHIWVARRNAGGGYDSILPVDWIGTTQRGVGSTNYQIIPGDRVYVYSDKWRRADSNVQKVLSPFERILGATLLGASTVQEIRMNPSTSGSSTGR